MENARARVNPRASPQRVCRSNAWTVGSTQRGFNISSDRFQSGLSVGNCPRHCIKVMDHVLVACVTDFDASAFESVRIGFGLIPQRIKTSGVNLGRR
jgi:hypothetical protein